MITTSSLVILITAAVVLAAIGSLSQSQPTARTAQPPTDPLHHQRRLPAESTTRSLATSLTTMKDDFQLAKAKFLQQLEKDYSSTYMEALFHKDFQVGTSFLRSPSSQEGPAGTRLVHQLARKILTTTLSSSTSDNKSHRFVWVTGGHSSAAGHGNFYNESYTAVLGQSAAGLFASVGLELETKNYAMGGTSSGKEVTLCMESIFGQELDVLAWDYGMTDGSDFEKVQHFCYRANALHPSHPACVAIVSNGRTARGRQEVLRKVEASGGTSLIVDSAVHEEVIRAVPDSVSTTDLPPLLASFKCGKQVEEGEPDCRSKKYTRNGTCDRRKFQVRWHPGFKWHALTGNLLALSMMSYLEEALAEITKPGVDPAELLKQYEEEQTTNIQQLLDDTAHDEVLYKTPTFCHTALLPAEIRFDGSLTESDEKGFFTYDKGIEEMRSINLELADKDPMPLTYMSQERQKCSVPLNVDYKDAFLARGTYDGFTTLTLPNAAEKKAYAAASTPFKGRIAICFRTCSWGRCPKGTIGSEAISESKASIEVNGGSVIELEEYKGCHFLKGSNGLDDWKADDEGQYVIAIKVHEKSDFMPISSVVLW